MTWLLVPGLRLLRRDERHLQVGLDAPHAAVLPDSPGVRRLLGDLAAGAPLSTLDDQTGRALASLVRAGLLVGADAEAAQTAARARCAVHLDVPPDLEATARDLTERSGLGAPVAGEASVALVWTCGEPDRERLDAWMRSATPHLPVAELPGGEVRLGPYVDPGRTACLRCVDAHLRERDPRRDLLVAQHADGDPLRPLAPDPALRTLALGWAVRDLALAAVGDEPSTWSAVVTLGETEPERTAYRRHVHCGCSWDEEVAQRAASA
ncbi:hypothetical protein [Nocardioides flavescens]|uniref:Bacteriocin biosynthesis cyclodehydratase domain-containing protein n=1 Tax=Nocardioides flavescens TaxID=2691959 RepID=A0A6L7EVZ1_9ACTN|nr:hypothetical protein [Nocardioides flavescens]MXG91657.1 hypothetical protein [Nocardioides flavescens]